MSGKFWYRVELSYEGVVMDCTQVCTKEFGSRFIYFVSALDPEEAQEKVRKRWARLRESMVASAERNSQSGLCPCGAVNDRPDRIRCSKCQARNTETQRERRSLTEDERVERTDRNRKQARENLLKVNARSRPIAQKALQETVNRRWDADGFRLSGGRLIVIRQVLRAYDRDPAAFRAWVLRMLGESQEAQAAE